MADLLDETAVAQYKEVFDLFDYDGDGVIEANELNVVLQGLGQNVTEAEVSDLLSEVDSTGSGTLGFEEFLQLMTFRMKDTDLEAELKSLFADIDADGDGVIGGKDADKLADSSESAMTAAEAREALKEMDQSGSGRGRFDDFAATMTT